MHVPQYIEEWLPICLSMHSLVFGSYWCRRLYKPQNIVVDKAFYTEHSGDVFTDGLSRKVTDVAITSNKDCYCTFYVDMCYY